MNRFLLLATLFFSLGTAQETRISVPYEHFVLPNGLNIILHEDHTIPRVSVNIWYHVGSSHEKPGRTGFAHLFEHIMFEGSKHVPERCPLQGIHAVSTSNVFVVGLQSLIYHYDGQTWQQLKNIIEGNWWLHAVWATDREAFIVGADYDGFKTVILHGR